jgi:UTP--glucose-1-phosphate uridylyltransferase
MPRQSKASAVRKVVFPVGGLGTRFLPATKSMPKEMLPVVDTPLIHYAFEEARAAGIEEFIFVTGRNKHAIEDHFDHAVELQSHLNHKQKARELALTRDWLPPAGSIAFTRQQEPRGLGHAVWCARHLVGNEPFAVILADDFIEGTTPCLKQMVEAYAAHPGAMMAVMDVPREQTSQYGIVDLKRGAKTTGALVAARAVVEKPVPAEAPSTLAIIGRYVLPPEIFALLGTQTPGAGGEIQLTDAINRLIGRVPVHGYRFEGTRHDCGSLAGFVTANLSVALARKELRGKLLAEIERVAARSGVRISVASPRKR